MFVGVMSVFLVSFLFLLNLFSASCAVEINDVVSDLQGQINFLMEARELDRKEIETLKKNEASLKEARRKDREELEELKVYVHEQRTFNTSEVRDHLQRRQAFLGAGVGFTACISVRDLHGLGPHQTLIFDNAITNEGGAYHTTTGIFTAPYDGLYAFHFSGMTEAGKQMYFQLVKDGVTIDDVLTDGRNDQSWESSSEMWVLKLSSGNKVWMRSTNGGEVHGFCHTMFTGFLISETEM